MLVVLVVYLPVPIIIWTDRLGSRCLWNVYEPVFFLFLLFEYNCEYESRLTLFFDFASTWRQWQRSTQVALRRTSSLSRVVRRAWRRRVRFMFDHCYFGLLLTIIYFLAIIYCWPLLLTIIYCWPLLWTIIYCGPLFIVDHYLLLIIIYCWPLFFLTITIHYLLLTIIYFSPLFILASNSVAALAGVDPPPPSAAAPVPDSRVAVAAPGGRGLCATMACLGGVTVREIGRYDTCWWYSLCNF